MSYDIYLHLPESDKSCDLPEKHQMKGGTYQVGGCPKAEFNITWNYAPFYYKIFGDLGIRTIYGKTSVESIPLLVDAINQLGDDVDDNYWAATEGNAKHALRCLLTLAEQCPDAIWDGD